MKSTISVYLEIGSRRTFATALDWPGWCRAGRDEAAALQVLYEYGPRYASILLPAQFEFQVPVDVLDLIVVERLQGNTTTDFGAPDRSPTIDSKPMDAKDLYRLQALLIACWQEFDRVVELTRGKILSTGPRGGGRSLDKIAQHVFDAEVVYLSQLGGKLIRPDTARTSLELVRQEILVTLEASARGEIAAYGPRGGKRWSPRYFIRRAAWHIVDHLWEIENRLDRPVD